MITVVEHHRRFTTPNRPLNPRLPIPATTRAAVLKRARGRCERCRCRVPLELHHRHYNTQGKEEPIDLKALCRDCHRGMHLDPEYDYWIDPVEMQLWWAIGEDEEIVTAYGWRGGFLLEPYRKWKR